MTEKPEAEIPDTSSTETANFCTAIGELILWASMIDGQLNKALIGALALPDHPMIGPVVAQLDARQKAELLKKRTKFISNVSWRNGIKNWVERAEKVNANRNYVAHHAIRTKAGKIGFYSDQLGKVLDTLKLTDQKIEVIEDKGIKEVTEWIGHAKQVYAEGANVLDNLDCFRAEATKATAKKAGS